MTNEINVYSDDQIRQLRLKICERCIYSSCNGNLSNKCNINELVCTRDNNISILNKTSNISNTCPLQYWAFTNSKRPIAFRSYGCGCGG